MIVGLHCFVMGWKEASCEWECPRDVSGDVAAISMARDQSFHILEFKLCKRNDGPVEYLVTSTESSLPTAWTPSAPPPVASYTSGLPTMSLPPSKTWVGGVDAHCFERLVRKGLEWHVEEGDAIKLKVLNLTANNARFAMGLLVDDGAQVIAKQPRWWADEDGNLKRPLTFLERGLKLGTKIGGLIVINPFTYEGLDAPRDEKPS